MVSDRELIAIISRLLNSNGDEQDIEQLNDWKQTSSDQNVVQQAKYIINIAEGKDIKIGDSPNTKLLEEIIDLLRSRSVTPDLDIDWKKMSQVMLEEYQRLTTNPLTAGEGVFHSSDRVYVPLGLVERKRKPQRKKDVSPEKGSELYQETEITQRFENKEFLEQVLKLGQSSKSQGKRIAIIGEPGAGKTTLLQQIAKWITKQVEEAIVIWVSLADLRGQELEYYLLERWLQAVVWRLGQAEVTPQIKDAFVAQFQQGRIWLLLDGVDEMQVSSVNPLSEISQQVRMGGLLSQAKIVLTCRINLWDSNSNALDNFDTYRTLEFSYPKEVEQSIHNWFDFLSSTEQNTAQKLCNALRQEGKERIRDLVKNPLRLTLLCLNWHLGEGNFPETKAGLYEQFVNDYYEWKKEQFVTTGKQRKDLNRALGDLAREAIDKEKTRFRLRQEFVCEYLGEPDDEDSLFRLALTLGWLNNVGVDAKNSRKGVYAFFHPSFQEYFAALVIDDWDFFLPREHQGEPVEDKNNPHRKYKHYRIFEPQWKEVILVWLGRPRLGSSSPGGMNEENFAKEEKKAFINALVDFDDGCREYLCKVFNKGFYEDRAYFFAAAGIAEFPYYSKADEIVEQIVHWCFDYSDEDDKHNKILAVEAAREALLDTDLTKAKRALVQRLEELTDDEFIRTEVNNILEKIDPPDNETEINSLVNSLNLNQGGFSLGLMATRLGEIGTGNENEIEALVKLFESTQDGFALGAVTESLIKLGKGNKTAIVKLMELLNSTDNEEIHIKVAEILDRIDPGNKTAIPMLIKILESNENKDILIQAAEIYSRVDLGNESTIAKLETRLLDSSENEDNHIAIAYCLGTIDPGNEKAIARIVNLLKSPRNENFYGRVTECLKKIDPHKKIVIKKLVQLLNSRKTKNKFIRKQVKETLVKIAQEATELSNQIAIEALVKLLDPNETEDEFMRRKVAFALGEIGTDNQTAMAELMKLLDSNETEEIRIVAAESLVKIDPGNQTAMAALVKLLNSIENEEIRIDIAERLETIDPGNETAIATLVKLLKPTTQHQYTSTRLLTILRRIGIGNKTVIAALVTLLDPTNNKETCILAAEVLEEIDRGNKAAFAALVKLLKSTDEDIRIQAAKILGKMESGKTLAIAALANLLKSTQNETNRCEVARTLGKIGKGNQTTITALVSWLVAAKRGYPDWQAGESYWNVANTLQEICSPHNCVEVVSILKNFLNDPQQFNNAYYKDAYMCYNVIWHCAHNMSYPNFYQAWHN